MANYAESKSGSAGSPEFDVQAHVGRRMHVIETDAGPTEFEDPGNFPEYLLAYLYNMHGVKSDEFFVGELQTFLRTDTLGKTLNEILSKVVDDAANEEILQEIYQEDTSPHRSAFLHSQVIERAAVHLPASLNGSFLRDVGRFDEAA